MAPEPSRCVTCTVLLVLAVTTALAATTLAAAPPHVRRLARQEQQPQKDPPQPQPQDPPAVAAAEDNAAPKADPPSDAKPPSDEQQNPATDPEADDTDTAGDPDLSDLSDLAPEVDLEDYYDYSASSILGAIDLVLNYEEVRTGSPLIPDEYVYTGGTLRGIWDSCAKGEECFIESEYTDSMSFEFYFSPAEYDFGEPTINANGGKANPAVVGFSIDEEEFFGEFLVQYDCKASSDDLTTIELTLPVNVATETNITVRWTKKCAVGDNDRISFGFIDGDLGEEHALDGPIDVPANDPSTTLFIRAQLPARHQRYLKPVFESKDTKVATVSATGYGSTITDQNSEVTVHYQCVSEGTAEISVLIDIPPWNPLKATIKKTCDGKGNVGPVTFLSIGTTAGASDVVSEGKAVDQYAVNEVDMFSSLPIIVDERTNSVEFYLFNAYDGGELQIDHISLTVENDRILYARLASEPQFLRSLGTVLTGGDTGTIRVHFTCKNKGTSSLVVTLAMQPWSNIQFGITKECQRPKKLKESAFLTTAGSIFGVLGTLTLIGGALVAYSFIKRRRETPKYQPAGDTAT